MQRRYLDAHVYCGIFHTKYGINEGNMNISIQVENIVNIENGLLFKCEKNETTLFKGK